MQKYILTVTMNPALDQIIIDDGKTVLSAGGKGINVARTLKYLGSPVRVTGLLGGKTGNFIKMKLDEEKINASFLNIREETRINHTIISSRNKNIRRIIQEGIMVPANAVAKFKNKYKMLLIRCRMAVLSGRNARGAPPSVYAELIRLAQRKKIPVCVDASGPALRAALRASPFLIKLNFEEAENAFGRKLNSMTKIKMALKRFHEYGISVVIITLGRKGAVASDRKDIFFARGPHMEPLNDVGCGDAFLGGYIYAWVNGYEFKDAVKLASASGAANTATVIPGLVEKKSVMRILNQVSIKNIG